MKSGIYLIFNKKSGKAYIGQTIDLQRRKKDHIRALRKGEHHNRYLQRAFNKDGENAFSFIVLERCKKEDLDAQERHWIMHYQTMDSFIGYNLESGGNEGKEVSEKTRDTKRGCNNPMYGKKLSAEHLEILRSKNRGLHTNLTEKDVETIKLELLKGKSEKELAEQYNITFGAISRIKRCKNWEYVREDLNKFLINMDSEAKKERNKKIKRLESMGKSRAEISRIVGCTPATVQRVLGTTAPFLRKSDTKKEIINGVIKDFENGLSKSEITKKYKISDACYVSYTSTAYKNKKNSLKETAIKMRKSGIMVKDVAKELGFARTTISKWTKNAM